MKEEILNDWAKQLDREGVLVGSGVAADAYFKAADALRDITRRHDRDSEIRKNTEATIAFEYSDTMGLERCTSEYEMAGIIPHESIYVRCRLHTPHDGHKHTQSGEGWEANWTDVEAFNGVVFRAKDTKVTDGELNPIGTSHRNICGSAHKLNDSTFVCMHQPKHDGKHGWWQDDIVVRWESDNTVG